MASTNKTSLGLNMWEASDKPVRQDFINDNKIIDERIAKLNSDLAILYKLSGGTSIPSGANLNDYKVPGNYYCNANVTVLTLLNIPSNLVSAFTLKVEYGTGIGYPCQTIRNFHTGDFYYRVYDTFNQFWGVWYVFKGTKV